MTLDVLAHYLFAATSFFIAYLLWNESKDRDKKNSTSVYWVGTGLIVGVLYFCLLLAGGSKPYDFSSLDTHSIQHLLIAMSLIMFGVLGLVHKDSKLIWKVFRIIIILEVSAIAWLHSADHSHLSSLSIAGWLQPYHHVLAVLLFVAGISLIFESIPRLHRINRYFLLVGASAFIIIGLLLALYRNPYTYSEPCNVLGRDIRVEITEEHFTPRKLFAHRCDTLVFAVTDDEPHIIAFGKHAHHEHYPGHKEKSILKGDVVKLHLTKPGVFIIHDHDNARVKTVLNVSD